MDLGDIVLNDLGQRFVVSRLHEDGTGLLLNRSDTNGVTVSLTDAAYRVEANPYRDWPLLVLAAKFSKWGSLNQVGVPKDTTEFEPMVEFRDWLLGHPLRTGGALYLNPKLGLRFRDRVVLVFANKRTSVPIPLEFGTVSRRTLSASIRRVPKPPETFYNHLMQDEEDDESP